MAIVYLLGWIVHKKASSLRWRRVALRGEVREYGRIANTSARWNRLLRKLGGDGMTLRFATKRGPCGYGIQPSLVGPGHGVRRGPLAIPKRAATVKTIGGMRQPAKAPHGPATDGGVGSGCAHGGDARSGTGTARRGAQPAPGAPASSPDFCCVRAALWPAGLDQAASPLAGRAQLRAGGASYRARGHIAAVEARRRPGQSADGADRGDAAD